MKSDTILFDINETILDLTSLRAKFKSAFDDDKQSDIWFSMLLHASTVCALTGVQTDFGSLASATLDRVCAKAGKSLSDEVRDEILDSFTHMSAHSDVKSALSRLRSEGYRTVAFSNSSDDLIERQIQNSELSNHFDDIVSVEKSGTFKPDRAAYNFVARHLDKPIGNLRLVATHDWDTHGALAAGMKAAYIDRSGTPYYPQYEKPDVSGTTMDEVVDQILELDRQK
ncbi:MAG: haloacid dehalogenase type II [Akkermansiaceae bacterium]